MDPVIDSWQLRMFAVLARTGSFTETARQLGLTQSAVSHSLRKLEDDLGSRLMERAGRKPALTPAGERLLACADAMIQQMTRARAEVAALARGRCGPVRVACPPDLAGLLLPPVFCEFRESFPRHPVVVIPDPAPDPLQVLEEQRADLVLAPEPPVLSRLQARRIFQDTLVFLTPARHPWAHSRMFDPAALASEAVLVCERGPAYLSLEAHLQQAGVRLEPAAEPGHAAAMVEMVRRGLGIGIGPAWVAREEIRRGTVCAVPVPGWNHVRHWSVLSLRDRPLTLAAATFAGLCRCVGAVDSPAAA